jgi:tetratricopeptide (TPR) repeat protein
MIALTIADHPATARADRETSWTALVGDFLAHAKTTPRHLTAILSADPMDAMGWCAKGFFAILLARFEMRVAARDALTSMQMALRRRRATSIELRYMEALSCATTGQLAASAAILDLILADDPDDSFAAKLSHALRFMLGDVRRMLASIDQVVRRCDPAHEHLGYLLGCQAFALEENGDYAEAERAGREAVLRAPRDAWGVHAIAHVHEMTGQARAGVDWLVTHERNISHCNNFSGHVFWHLALFRLELGDVAGVLQLYDDKIRAERTDDFRDIANAASLLGRLTVEGVPVGDRWEELADISERRILDQSLVFADLHYSLALAGAGRADKAEALVRALHEAHGSDDQSKLAHALGATMADAIRAWGEGDHARAAGLLMSSRRMRQKIGGSHAQRDIFEQITIDSLIRCGRRDEARVLLGERLAARTRNRFAEERLGALMGARAVSPF